MKCFVGWDSVVSIVTMGWMVQGSSPDAGQGFLNPSGPDPGPTQPAKHWVLFLFPRGKEAGAWRSPPTSLQHRGERKSRAVPLLSPGPLCPVEG